MLYETRDYFISKTNTGYYIGHKHSNRHGHNIKSFKVAKKIIHNIEHNIKPHTKSKYLLETYHRLATDKRYIEQIEVLQSKSKEYYINVNKRRNRLHE